MVPQVPPAPPGPAGSSSTSERLSRTVTLQPSDVRSLDGDGFVLVPAVSGKIVFPLELRFHVPLTASQYQCEGVFLFVDWMGNYSFGRASEWRIPADGTPTGLLTTHFTAMNVVSMNNASFMAHPLMPSNLMLNATGTITGGSSPVTIEVIYELRTAPV